MNTKPIIELRNVTAWRGSTRVFKGLNLSIRKGEHTVILGPNGAGKSTLLKLLTRELYPVQEEGA
ncbi:MAG TPA: ATP-binding cassette domain-containing protein, partial [Spirochaetes bacterium]|nr:ATP-binding cassette domain-containing protein [Spirochaetota bacterium]